MKIKKWFGIKQKEELAGGDDSRSLFDVALQYHESGRFTAAYPLYLKALKGFESDLEQYPENTQFQSAVAMTRNNLGNLLRDMGRLEEAKDHYENALTMYEQLLNSDPENTQFQSYVATTRNNLGNLLRDMGRLEEAKEHYENALTMREQLLSRDQENTQYQSDVATTRNNLGNLLSDTGRQEEAKERYESALTMYEQLLNSDPENTQYQSYVAGTRNNLGNLLSNMGRLEEAKERYESALQLVKEQPNPHYTGWTLSLLGKLELDNDEPDLETAQSCLEASVEKLHKDIRPDYPNAVNWLALCYYKFGEQKKGEAQKEKSRDRTKKRVEEASQFFSRACTRYKEAYELPYAWMPRELLIDAYLADTFSTSVQVIAEEADNKAVTLLNESIVKIKNAVELAQSTEDQRKRVEGAWHDLVAKQCIRSMSLFKGDSERQEKLLGDAIDHMAHAAQNFEELHSDKSAASCHGCICLYNGLKKFKDGVMSDKLKSIAESHDEFKRASSFYQEAESEVEDNVISTINDAISGIEAYYDALNRALEEGRKPGIADYRPVYENISNLIEQISTVGFKNLFKAYIFDEAMNLVDERKPKIKGVTNIYTEEVVMGGDVFKNIQNATIINKSVVENSFNKISKDYGEDVAKALVQIAEFIEKSGNKEAGENFDAFNEELNKTEPKKSVLKALWGGIETALPAIKKLAGAIAKLAPLFV